jgi:hypothetical protein
MSFFPFYLNTEYSSTHIYLISGASVLIGLVTLIGLFAQKAYIVYFVKDLPTDDLVMTSKSASKRPPSSEDQQKISITVEGKLNGATNGPYDGVLC